MNALIEKTIDGLKLDRSEWKLVKFGDVAIQQKESVDRANTELTRYVKGEHMNSEDLHLREWGELTDEYLGPAFIRKFEEGDILYGSRRTYLRKVVIAPFDGITSNTTFVIKANEKKIDKRLLPFVMLSEGFTQHSIKNSKGSVNPYVNWKDLSGYEFLLPPKAQQAELGDLLWSVDESMEADQKLLKSLLSAKEVLFNDAVYKFTAQATEFGHFLPRHPVVKLEKVVESFQYGISESLDETGEIPVLRMNNLQNGVLDVSELKYFTPNGDDHLGNFILNNGDILFNRTNSFDLVGKTCLFDKDGKYTFASYLIRLVANKALVNPEYLNFYMNSYIGLAKIRKYRTPGVSQSNINAGSLKKLVIPLPDINLQNGLMKKINGIRISERQILSKINEVQALRFSLINQVF